MTEKSDEFLNRLLSIFRVEAGGHLQAISTGLLALGRGMPHPEQGSTVEAVFREIHSLKGAARAVNLGEMEAACQSLENIFSALKGGSLAISAPLADLMLEIVDRLMGILAQEDPSIDVPASRLNQLRQQLDMMAAQIESPSAEALSRHRRNHTGSPPARRTAVENARGSTGSSTGSSTDSSADRSATAAETRGRAVGVLPAITRVSTERFDSVMRQIEELLLPRLAFDRRVQELEEAAVTVAAWRKQCKQIQPRMRVMNGYLEGGGGNNGLGGMARTQDLSVLLAYLDGEQQRVTMLENLLVGTLRRTRQDRRNLGGMIDNLMRDVREMQLLPFSSLLDVLLRHARELARERDKSVRIVTHGENTTIDRRILEEVKDPLLHLLRNAVDHGIEHPDAREAMGKSRQGTITLTCSHDDGRIEILVADDGRGMDTASLKSAAGKLGFASSMGEGHLADSEAMELAFRSGVTTSPAVTDISGRGLGLAIVREKVEGLQGSVTVSSSPGGGAGFRLLLPLTAANLRGVVVRVASQFFVIPSLSVDRVLRIVPKDIRTVKNGPTVLVDEQPIALVWLSDVLELPRSSEHAAEVEVPRHVPAVVVYSGTARVAFRADEIESEQEVLIKPLGHPLKRIRNVTGVSVLPTGLLAPVLNVPDLVKSAVRHSAASPVSLTSLYQGKRKQNGSSSILVVEDSITARTLLKQILESAGYRVATAVDGAEGYSMLKAGAFDLVVSDIEMPRLDGFALTAMIRGDKQLADLPVVLVTALDSDEHRERGLDCGANAYIVKSALDQSNLLDTIRRLVGKGV